MPPNESMRCACRSKSRSLQDGLSGNGTGKSSFTGLSYQDVSDMIWKDYLRGRRKLSLPGPLALLPLFRLIIKLTERVFLSQKRKSTLAKAG